MPVHKLALSLLNRAAPWCVALVLVPRPVPAQMGEVQAFRATELRRHAALARVLSAPASDISFDAVSYRLDLTVTTAPQYLRGAMLMQARSLIPDLNTATLDLSDTMHVDSVRTGAGVAPFARIPGGLRITLDRAYGPGEMFALEVFYRGRPVETGFGSFVFSEHGGIPWVWSLSEPYGARDWWPCKDHPSDKADSVDIVVTCDSAFSVGSNGLLRSVSVNGDGTRTWHWAERHPIATYLVSIALTNYARFSHWFHASPGDSMEVLNFVLPEHLGGAEPLLARTVNMLRIFSDRFGLYPFYNEKYGHAEFGRGGAMEHQTMTSATYAAFAEYVVAHELAHQWWGNLITCASWPHLWLNEGFATYSEALYFEEQYGGDAYRNDMLPKLQRAKTAQGPLVVADTSSVSALFDHALVYDKGAAVLHMLRHILGDSLFFASLRAYAADPARRYGTAVTAQFREACETATGRDLAWFFDQWTLGTGYPRYHYSWASTSDSTIRLTIGQTATGGSPPFFRMPIDVLIRSSAGEARLRVDHTTNPQEFDLPVAGTVSGVSLDPDRWILADTEELTGIPQAPDARPERRCLLDNYPNPFNGSTVFRIELSAPGPVTLVIYDLLGREVARPLDRRAEAGLLEITWSAPWSASGIYMARLVTPSGVSIRRVILLR